MSIDLPIWIMEPEPVVNRLVTARILAREGKKPLLVPEIVSIGDIKQQLKKIREYTRSNINSLVKEVKTNLRQKYPKVKVISAADHIEAARYIDQISDGIKVISTNNSSTVNNEMKPELLTNGFTIINSYLDEFEVTKREIFDYWDLPDLLNKNLRGTFDISTKMAGLTDGENKKYLAVLGVNAISAEDSTIFFLQHFSNIHNDLRQANKVVLVAGLDKIVQTRQDAAFQTRCMSIFGLENVLLEIEPKPSKSPSIAELSPPLADEERELHLILLDNGRSKILQSDYTDLFLCIGCRACNQHCPVQHSFKVDYIWTPRTYLNQLLYDTSRFDDVCLHCEACRIDCPVDIDLPLFMWRAKIDHISQHRRSLKHIILGMPEVLARLGTLFAPFSNWMMRLKLLRIPMEIMIGIDRRTILPTFHHRTFRKWFKQHV